MKSEIYSRYKYYFFGSKDTICYIPIISDSLYCAALSVGKIYDIKGKVPFEIRFVEGGGLRVLYSRNAYNFWDLFVYEKKPNPKKRS